VTWGKTFNIYLVITVHPDQPLPGASEGMKIFGWREEAKWKDWGTSCCGCTVDEEILQATYLIQEVYHFPLNLS